MIKLSIIIPTYNEELNIARLLNSIICNPFFDPTKVEILVIDSVNTTDKTSQIVASFENVILEKTGPERSSQRNKGADLASGEWLYFVDADMEFSDDLLSNILENLSVDQMFVVPERIPGNTLYCRAVNIEKACYENNDLISAARIFPKKIFEEVGKYNIKMISGEDWELDRRLKKAGLKMYHLNSYILHHEESIGFIKSIQKKIYYAKKLENYNVGSDAVVNPIYRYGLLFKKPKLAARDPLAFVYLLILKTFQYGIGFLAYKFR